LYSTEVTACLKAVQGRATKALLTPFCRWVLVQRVPKQEYLLTSTISSDHLKMIDNTITTLIVASLGTGEEILTKL